MTKIVAVPEGCVWKLQRAKLQQLSCDLTAPKPWGPPNPRVQQLAWQKSYPVSAGIEGHFPDKMAPFCRMKSFPSLHLTTKTEFPSGNVLMAPKLLQILANSAGISA